eukprot:TRINITY_DN38235_c0_g1_i1.p3 TRINITY_DN38235_c0_g1~~TRINITY_DN38235_c0_g1_i1.p3  ORF type:complete len:130 (+),score=24.51 TRINITY_DN38235_c0_g1_i1:870-1259(+)
MGNESRNFFQRQLPHTLAAKCGEGSIATDNVRRELTCAKICREVDHLLPLGAPLPGIDHSAGNDDVQLQCCCVNDFKERQQSLLPLLLLGKCGDSPRKLYAGLDVAGMLSLWVTASQQCSSASPSVALH